MNGRNILHNINLKGIGNILKKLEGDFNSLHIVHIFREQIEKADALMKKMGKI